MRRQVQVATVIAGAAMAVSAVQFLGSASAEIDRNDQHEDPVWQEEVLLGIQEAEYRASITPLGLQAPNRAHDLRTFFDGSGIVVTDRSSSERVELLRLGLVRVGRTSDGKGGRGLSRSARLDPIALRNDRNRVEIERAGITEWFINGPNGLEHGFDIHERPLGTRDLELTLEVSTARAELQGDQIVFKGPSGRELNYGGLHVYDADGQTVAARFAVPDPHTIVIVARDQDAMYPITVDPLLTSTFDAMVESDQADARLGGSVCRAGDVNGDGYGDVIVGAVHFDSGQENEGAAFIYHGSAAGLVTQAATMVQPDQAYASMGSSVASAGDVNGDGYDDVVVGASAYDNGQENEGAAFVYHGGPSGISSIAAVRLEPDLEYASFGGAVSGAGDVNGDGYADVVVAAIGYSNGETNEGAFYVHHGGPSGVLITPAIIVEADLEWIRLGYGVSGAGDVNGDGYSDVIAGAPAHGNGEQNEGAFYVHHGSATGITTPAAMMVESNQSGASLGGSVASAGDVNGDGYADVIVGASNFDSGQFNEGAALVYHGGPDGISSVAATTMESNQVGASLGISVSGAGDLNGDGYADVIAGANHFENGEQNEGAFYVYLGGATGAASTPTAVIESDQGWAYLGLSVSGAGDVNGDGYSDVIVGSDFFDNGQSEEGVAFIYHGGASGIRTSPTATVDSDQSTAWLGYSVSGAGDVNGDGYTDVIVGASLYDNGQTDEGAAFVYHGGDGGISTTPAIQLESDQEGAQFGGSVSDAGDVNGDGYGDVIVGASLFESGFVDSDEGAAFIYHGSPGGVSATAATVVESNQAGAVLGNSVSGAGDVNGDGYADVIVGSTGYDGGQPDVGAAFVYHGSEAGLSSVAATILESDQPDAQLGVSVSDAGDVNGDGYSDVIVGANLFDSHFLESDEGAAYIYHGGESGVSTQASTILESNQIGAQLGFSVSGAGDVNADAYADVIVGSRLYDNGQDNEGVAFVHHGSASGISLTAATVLQADQSNAQFGSSVSSAGDVNGDGYADVVIGAMFYDGGQFWEGAAFVHHGSASGVAVVPATAIESDQVGALLGVSVSGAGDVDGDGYADVIVGAHTYDNGLENEGIAFVHHGNIDGRTVQPGQLRGNGDPTSVQPWGISSDSDDFQVRMRATHPDGVGKVMLEVEYVGPGEVFGGAGSARITSANWTDATAEGVDLTETLAGLTNDTLYRWRARVLYASHSVTEPGITPPLSPAHGPWRRLFGQSTEADLRVKGDVTGLVGTARESGLFLEENVPNPFNPTTRVGFALDSEMQIQLSVYDVSGRRVAILASGLYPAGEFEATWDGIDELGRAVSSGIYFARLEAGRHSATQEMVLLR